MANIGFASCPVAQSYVTASGTPTRCRAAEALVVLSARSYLAEAKARALSLAA